jgi:hypothetical protein
MNMYYDYAANAACPQRPVWQVAPVGYKWAQSVFQGRNPHCIRGVKKEPLSRQCWKVFERVTASLFRQRQIMQMEEPLCNM